MRHCREVFHGRCLLPALRCSGAITTRMRSLAEHNGRHLSSVADAVIEALALIAKMAGSVVSSLLKVRKMARLRSNNA